MQAWTYILLAYESKGQNCVIRWRGIWIRRGRLFLNMVKHLSPCHFRIFSL
ncbi:hypothetical protein CIPAW_11G081000 [Carya illinoinensis]|uniref:Uncharacterized protein n=1 Tax=Carya illinoinensis TaxID=32201 RepID=A0A8T1P148_CARIL|nr:hypothetical protein CIPAW_11G081000 [Carya illinoinensis]